MLRDSSREMSAIKVRWKKVQSERCGRILETVKPEFAGLSMEVSRSISGWCAGEVPEIAHTCNEKVHELQKRSEAVTEQCFMRGQRSGLVTILQFT